MHKYIGLEQHTTTDRKISIDIMMRYDMHTEECLTYGLNH